MKASIYVHIPFCQSKCFYCAFTSFACHEHLQQRYFENLVNELKKRADRSLKITSIYFGGGTPSFVEPKFIEMTMLAIQKNFLVQKNAEITIECNPCSVTLEKLKFYKNLSFNRLSVGVQSFSDIALEVIGRSHHAKDAIKALMLADQAGFSNVSADLLIGLPNGNVVKDARRLLKLGVKHISAYMLQVEQNTPLKNMVESETVNLQSDDDCVNNYHKLCDFLQKNGLKQYEISNFAFEGFESKHNQGYWSGQKYLGFGIGAHSFDGKNRWANALNFEDYFLGKLSLQETLSKKERDEEQIMLGLRCSLGVDISKLSYDMTKNLSFQILLSKKILKKEGNIVTLDPKYYSVSNTIIMQLLEN